jgi:hypothetical protein
LYRFPKNGSFAHTQRRQPAPAGRPKRGALRSPEKLAIFLSMKGFSGYNRDVEQRPYHPIASLLFFLLGALVLAPGPAEGYTMRREFTLSELEKNADVVFKGTALSSTQGTDSASGETLTQFKIVSVMKGVSPSGTVRFDHIDHPPNIPMDGPPPINYHFETDKTYIVFAKATETPGVYKSLWNMPQSEGNQGVFSCADDKPALSNLKAEVWSELTGLLRHSESSDVLYAIQELDQLSGGGSEAGAPRDFSTTDDFDRRSVVDAVHVFVTSTDAKIAQAAIETIGSHNPYMTQERAWFWLATVGSGEISGLTKMNPKMTNLGGELYSNDLFAAADKGPDDATRALALRALGLVRQPEVGQRLLKYLVDPAPAVRAAAMVVLADYPDLSTLPQLSRMGVDPNAGVRVAVAQCIGFGQITTGIELLSHLLTDTSLDVRKAAAQSLLSFSARDSAVADIMRANDHAEFGLVFVLALARVDPAPYRDSLLLDMQSWSPATPLPAWYWGGSIPAYDARQILFNYLRGQPSDKLKSGEFDRYLDAIDKAALGNMGSPLEVYAFYVRHGLTDRAQAIRQAALKAFPYQQAISYDQAEQHPEIYDQ